MGETKNIFGRLAFSIIIKEGFPGKGGKYENTMRQLYGDNRFAEQQLSAVMPIQM